MKIRIHNLIFVHNFSFRYHTSFPIIASLDFGILLRGVGLILSLLVSQVLISFSFLLYLPLTWQVLLSSQFFCILHIDNSWNEPKRISNWSRGVLPENWNSKSKLIFLSLPTQLSIAFIKFAFPYLFWNAIAGINERRTTFLRNSSKKGSAGITNSSSIMIPGSRLHFNSTNWTKGWVVFSLAWKNRKMVLRQWSWRMVLPHLFLFLWFL